MPRTRSRIAAASHKLLTALPELVVFDIFGYASALRPMPLDGSESPLMDEPSKWNWPEVPSDPATRETMTRQLRAVPSLLRRAAADERDVARIEIMIVTAGTAFLRAVSPALRDAVDEMAASVHLAQVGCPPADATARTLTVKDYIREQVDRCPWYCDFSEEIHAAGGFDTWFDTCKYIDPDRGFVNTRDAFITEDGDREVFEGRTKRRVPTATAPHAALVDRAHAILAHRAAAFCYGIGCDCCEDARFGEAMELTFYGKASAMPWPIDAWHISISRKNGTAFNPNSSICRKLRAFAIALAPSTAGDRLRELPAGERTTRVDLFGAPTRWTDYAEGLLKQEPQTYSFVPPGAARPDEGAEEPHPKAGTREFILGADPRENRWQRREGITHGSSEPPDDVLSSFCAFSFLPAYADMQRDEYDWDRDWSAAARRGGGYAMRAADLCVPDSGIERAEYRDFVERLRLVDSDSDDDWYDPPPSVDGSDSEQESYVSYARDLGGAIDPVPDAPILLRDVSLELHEGRVHLVFEMEDAFANPHYPNDGMRLMVSGTIPTLRYPEESDGEGDEAYIGGGDIIINDDFVWRAGDRRRDAIARLADEQRRVLPRRRTNGLKFYRHPTLSGKSVIAC